MPKTITGEIIEIDDILLKYTSTTKIQNMFEYWDFSLKLYNYNAIALKSFHALILQSVDMIISVNISLSEAVQRNNFETNKFCKSLGKK